MDVCFVFRRRNSDEPFRTNTPRVRKRWPPASGGSITPIDEWLDQTRESFTRGVIELACRLNRHTSGFGELAATLWRAAGLKIGKEKLRELVEGRRLDRHLRRSRLDRSADREAKPESDGPGSGLLAPA